jgi:hypothetical protein
MEKGSITTLMRELMAAEAAINDVIPAGIPKLDIQKWRPGSIDPPALYHVISGSPFTQLDTGAWRDTLSIGARIAVPPDDYENEMEIFETYTDAFREVMDPVLGARRRPLNGAANWAQRTDMRSVLDEFPGVTYHAMEFLLQFRLDRMIDPT